MNHKMSSQTQQKQAHKPHILVVDDDKRICELITRYLQDHDFIALSANSAKQANEILDRFEVDALVVDVMMPQTTGIEFTQNLRKKGLTIPVLLLTALGEVDDRISGFESGADDYLTKPFEPRELILRLQSILRRTQKPQEESEYYQIGRWQFDPRHDELSDGDYIMPLSAVEANLLRALAQSANDVLSRDDLAARCNMDAGERTIDVQVTRLRRKLEEDTKSPRYLQTVRGKGYLLRAEAKS